MMTEVCSAGFPHSEIAGSKDICSSPTLIAAYHVFHRLSVPRHPPCALCSMTTSLYSVTTMGRSFFIRKKCVVKFKSYGLMSYHFQYVVFKVHVYGFKKLNPNCITRIELVLCIPIWIIQNLSLMGLSGLEPPTSRLSGVRSNRLSYKPITFICKTAFAVVYFLKRHPPTLPCRLQQSTIGRLCLNHRVRNGNGCVPQAHRHRLFLKGSSFQLSSSPTR